VTEFSHLILEVAYKVIEFNHFICEVVIRVTSSPYVNWYFD
jgi:hypothetical protein